MSFKDGRKLNTLAVVEVVRSEQISPNFRRITVGGEQLGPLAHHGWDHWFRLFLPKEEGETSFALPNRVDMIGYFRYLRMPSETRPYLRNYTVREFRPDALELDIDFVVHGDEGIATRWATRTRAGDRVALIDQGRAYTPDAATDFHVLVADETGLPAVAGILRDLPRDARGLAIIELPHADDRQELSVPSGFELQWLVRAADARPGALALATLEGRPAPVSVLLAGAGSSARAGSLAASGAAAGAAPRVSAYLVGEQALAAGARRHLVNTWQVPKKNVIFTGYWKLGAESH